MEALNIKSTIAKAHSWPPIRPPYSLVTRELLNSYKKKCDAFSIAIDFEEKKTPRFSLAHIHDISTYTQAPLYF